MEASVNIPPEEIRTALTVVHVLEATWGGTRRHLLDVTTAQQRRGYEVWAVVSTRRNPEFEKDIPRLKAAGVRVRVVQMQRRIAPFRDLVVMVRLCRFFRKLRPDIVHTHSAKAGIAGRVAARLACVPAIVHTPHVFPFQMGVASWKQYLYFMIERLVSFFTNRIVCVCPSEKEAALSWGLSSTASTLAVVPNGVALTQNIPDIRSEIVRDLQQRLGIGSSDFVVTLLGRFVMQKGHRFLVEAMPDVLETYPDTWFVMAGSGELRHSVHRSAQEKGVAGRCIILPDQEEVAPIYALSTVVVLPSLWEGLPYVLLDAMAGAKPVVASRVGGMQDVLTPDNAVLVPPGAPLALARGIKQLLADDVLRSRLGENARRTVAQHYRQQDMMEHLDRVYTEALRQS